MPSGDLPFGLGRLIKKHGRNNGRVLERDNRRFARKKAQIAELMLVEP